MPGPTINYRAIADALDHYKNKGYQYIEVPWLVSPESIQPTRPPEARLYKTFAGCLVASGEQSFIEVRKELCPGRKYMCATPCFRDERYDDLHLPQFFKVELILPLWKDDDPDKGVQEVLSDAWSFFSRYGQVVSVKTDIGFDINFYGFEVGSYGWREHDGFRWVYGTGLAEPRLTQIRKIRNDEYEAKVAAQQAR